MEIDVFNVDCSQYSNVVSISNELNRRTIRLSRVETHLTRQTSKTSKSHGISILEAHKIGTKRADAVTSALFELSSV